MQEHGSYELEVVGQTVVTRAFDSWNYETAFRWGEELKHKANNIIKQPWACLIDLRLWELTTPEAWSYIEELNVWGDKNKLAYVALVCALGIQETIIKRSQTVFTTVDVKFFRELKEANDWLNSVDAYSNQLARRSGSQAN
jgi:hypothetical protein